MCVCVCVCVCVCECVYVIVPTRQHIHITHYDRPEMGLKPNCNCAFAHSVQCKAVRHALAYTVRYQCAKSMSAATTIDAPVQANTPKNELGYSYENERVPSLRNEHDPSLRNVLYASTSVPSC